MNSYPLSVEEIGRMVRAYNPWPGTWMEYAGRRLKIIEIHLAHKTPSLIQPGAPLIENGEMLIGCGGNTVLQVERLQQEGKNIIRGTDFIRGDTWRN